MIAADKIHQCFAQQVVPHNLLQGRLADHMGALQVLTTWQSCVYVIYVYPHFPDLVAAMNALAEAEGEPSFHDIAAQAASDTEAVTEGDAWVICPLLQLRCLTLCFSCAV